MEIKFTDAELETISAALDEYAYYDNELETILCSLDDYLDYHDDDLSEDELIGGISVLDRVTSIREKIESVY